MNFIRDAIVVYESWHMVVNMIAERSESLNDKVPELNYFGGN